MTIKLKKESKTFNGMTQFYEHESQSTKTTMNFSVFLPCKKEKLTNCIIWLSGLTCNEENFITKSGVQKILNGTTTMVICPDTSPRGLDLPHEHDDYDFGSGAGFYVNATTEGYKEHYQMADYITKDIVSIIQDNFHVKNISISGHSMGGHGALILGLKNSHLFQSISAFSPIVNPIKCPWGQKAFKGYLGNNEESWSEYDATELIKNGHRFKHKILIDQGSQDEFLNDQLLTEQFKKACIENDQSVEIRYQDGFDHSYYFISSFLEDHIDFHLQTAP